MPELPPDLELEILRTLDGSVALRPQQVQQLCRRHPSHADAIAGFVREREGVEAALQGLAAGQGQAGVTHPADQQPRDVDGRQIGAFRILELIGKGGMGEVYLAEQREPVWRRVALKVIKLGMDTKAVLARFSAERQALALMDHSSIAKVFEAGATPEGRPYFAMEYVKGTPITRYCDDNKLSIEDRLALFRQVCSGVQHAHQKGVIHRDLTPNNVLVTVQDSKPVPKIIDFGLARATDHRLTEKTLFTEQGMILGTPEYMSPEQAGLNALDIDMRSDVYTLGVLLYELLTGELPFGRAQLMQAGLDKMCEIIRTQEPEKPSTKITKSARDTEAVAKLRRTNADKLLRRLRSDLDWVVLKCLEKDRARRYETVSELAADVQRHLEHEPVLARAPSVGYRLAKFARRYRGPLTAAGLVLLALIGGLSGTTFFWIEARDQAGIAGKNAEQAQRSADLFSGKVREFDQLAGVVYLKQALEAEKKLYPAWPHKIADLKRWLDEDAGRLLAMKPEIDRTIVDLRARALAPTLEEIEQDRTKHPQFAQWRKLSLKLAALEHAHDIRQGAELTLPLPAAAEQGMTAKQLNELAWPRVDSDEDRRIWGEEARALMLARLACEKAKDLSPAERASFGDTLAWAWLANGKDTEAVAQSEAALALASDTEKQTYTGYLTSLKAKVHAASGEAGAKALATLREQVTQLTTEVSTRRTYRFADEAQRFLHDTLSELQGNLTALEADERKSVVGRLSWAERVDALTLGHPKAHVTWRAARDAIKTADGVVASALYKEAPIDLPPQMGLVPIGMNPKTKLWEFYDVRSAWDGKSDPAQIPIPQHIEDGERNGHIEVGDDTGIVFVLLPGGTFTMGAQREDPNGPNYDRQAEPNETPHRVTLAPFFLARHELTKGQWKRLSGRADPSSYWVGAKSRGNPRAITDSHPVEQVDWAVCDELLRHHGLSSPSEAQWEYGCRAGTTSPWWTGEQASSLVGAANLLDLHAESWYPSWGRQEGDFDDGWCSHTAVGSYRPNAFGLLDMHGNVWEWCSDWYAPYSLLPRIGDGLRQVAEGSSSYRVYRGGSFGLAASLARSGQRNRYAPTILNNNLGTRPARAVQP